MGAARAAAAGRPRRQGVELGEGLVLPEDLVTETVAILGKRNSGKTTTARVLAEGLLEADLPVVIVDPTGVWYGLRTSADGSSDGYPVVIFGGDHGDAPLEETAGGLIADVIVTRQLSAVLDLSGLSKAASRRFVCDLLSQLYRVNRAPCHVVIDEADIFAPKFASRDTARSLGAMEDLFRRGRVKGLGGTAISQRPASLHNDILGMAEVLIAMRMTGVRDVAAIDDWVRLHADDDDAREVKASLPALPVGTGWVWSPGWLEVLRKVAVRRPRTFDSSATPRPGQTRPTVRRMAAVDLAALGEQITASLQQVKDNDPAELRRTIAELRRQLADRPTTPPPRPAPPQIVEVEVPVLPAETVHELLAASAGWQETAEQVLSLGRGVQAALDQLHAARPATEARPVDISYASRTETPQPAAAPSTRPAQPGTPESAQALPKAQRAVLTALAQHGPRSTVQVALLTGYSSKSGGYRNALSALRTAGYIDGRGQITATEQGLQALGAYTPLPTGPALVEWWKAHHLGKAERAVVDVLAGRWPDAVPVEEIAQATGYSAGSGGFRNALSRLRSLELAAGRG